MSRRTALVVMGLVACRSPQVDPDIDASATDAPVDSPADEATIPPLVDGGNLVWAKRAGGSSFDTADGIDVLADGSWLVTGHYASDVAVFGSGEPNETTLPPSPDGEYDVFLARYLGDGTLAWARRVVGGPTFQDDIPSDLAALPDGSSIMAGSYEGTTTFDGDTQDITLTGPSETRFLARFDASGSIVWARNAIGGNLAVLPDGTITEAGGLAIERTASDGSPVWLDVLQSSAYGSIDGVAMLADGSAIITGEFVGDLTFGAKGANPITLSAAGQFSRQSDAFIAKYAANGTLVFARVAASNEELEVAPHAIHAFADGSFVITGQYGGVTGTSTFGPGQATATTLANEMLDVFVARFDATGELVWVRRAICSGNEFGRDITASADGSSILVSGMFGPFDGTTITFGDPAQPQHVQLALGGERDAFVASFTADGHLRWAKRAGGSQDTDGGRIAAFPDGSTVVTGAFSQTSTFGPGEPAMITLSALGNADPFFAKLGP